ncbi:MAG: methyl-accepting chemotaxis protein, partial [Deltaproteobacteria bacterium]|nr:methyl-accepting chemotaxis protein [Deltaproteobacteria bacterium]
MNGRSFSIGRLGLRGKAIGTMTAALLVIMLAVGLTVYFQVVSQLKASLEALGKELVKNVTSESMFDLVYEQKDNEVKRLRKIIKESEEVVYIIVLKQAKRGETGVGGRPFVVFASEFREQGKPLDIESLVDIHMSNPEEIAERNDFIGVSEKVTPGKSMASEEDDDKEGGKKDEEASAEDELESEAMMFGEPVGLEEKPPAVESGDKKAEPVEALERSSGGEKLWGYVLLGLSTSKIQAQQNKLLWTLTIALLIAVVAFTGFIFWASTKIYRRLLVMMEMAKKISEGDLSETIEEETSDEIGMLANALNRISKNLNDMFRKIAKVTIGLGEAIERITAATEEVVQGAEYQVASVDETSSSISEIVISLKGVAENVEIL